MVFIDGQSATASLRQAGKLSLTSASMRLSRPCQLFVPRQAQFARCCIAVGLIFALRKLILLSAGQVSAMQSRLSGVTLALRTMSLDRFGQPPLDNSSMSPSPAVATAQASCCTRLRVLEQVATRALIDLEDKYLRRSVSRMTSRKLVPVAICAKEGDVVSYTKPETDQSGTFPRDHRSADGRKEWRRLQQGTCAKLLLSCQQYLTASWWPAHIEFTASYELTFEF